MSDKGAIPAVHRKYWISPINGRTIAKCGYCTASETNAHIKMVGEDRLPTKQDLHVWKVQYNRIAESEAV